MSDRIEVRIVDEAPEVKPDRYYYKGVTTFYVVDTETGKRVAETRDFHLAESLTEEMNQRTSEDEAERKAPSEAERYNAVLARELRPLIHARPCLVCGARTAHTRGCVILVTQKRIEGLLGYPV